jgi:hypothetical protein
MTLFEKYYERYRTTSDINEHLPILLAYAKQCITVTECGVRTPTSAYAFAAGLKNTPGNSYRMIDIVKSELIEPFINECELEGVSASFVESSDLTCDRLPTDLLFIDTWHIYGHLKRELAYWHTYVKKFIILHDTTVDELHGETIRMNLDPVKQSKSSGIPIEEILKGLGPAVSEFLEENPEWIVDLKLTNNNGLTILKRRS